MTQYQQFEAEGEPRRYGWLLTGSFGLGVRSWGESVKGNKNHRSYYHFQLGVAIFPFVQMTEEKGLFHIK